jgi:hypothetical protein
MLKIELDFGMVEIMDSLKKRPYESMIDMFQR